MDETLRQVGELLLGSIPTIILMVLLYVAYKFIVHKPLTAVLEERHSRTEGAVEKARADVAAAEARTAEYEQRLREARAAVFKAQEIRRQKAMQARAEALNHVRAHASEEIEKARGVIESEKNAAKAGLEKESARLASEIIRTILQPGSEPVPAGGGR